MNKQFNREFLLFRITGRIILFYGLAVCMYVTMGGTNNTYLLKALMLALPISFMKYFYDKNENILSYTLLSVALLVAVSFTGEGTLIFLTVVSYFLNIYEYSSVNRKNREINAPYGLIVFAYGYFSVYFLHLGVFEKVIYFATMIYLVNFLINKNYSNRKNYFERTNAVMSKNGSDTIFKANNKALKIVCIMVIAVMAVASIPRYGAVPLAGISDMYDKVIAAVTEFLDEDMPPVQISQGSDEESEEQRGEEYVEGEVAEAKDYSVYQIIFTVIGVILIVGLLYLICLLIIKLVRKFSRVTEEKRREISIGTVIYEKEEDTRTPDKIKKKTTRDNSYNSKIRNVYKKLILKNANEIIDFSLTPIEIEERLNLADKEYMDEIHRIYEETRYGSDEKTKADYELIRSYSEKI